MKTFLLGCLIPVWVWAGERSGTVQSTRLYTPPDPNATGGLRASIAVPNKPIVQVFALPVEDTTKVYRGVVGADGHSLVVRGLPVWKYGLLVLYEDGFFINNSLIVFSESE